MNWQDVVNSDAYKALSPQEKEEARQQYFNDQVASKIDPSEVSEAKRQFDAATAPYVPNDKGLAIKDLRTNPDGSIDITQFPVGAPNRERYAGKTPAQAQSMHVVELMQNARQKAADADVGPSPAMRMAAGVADVGYPVYNAIKALTGQESMAQAQQDKANLDATYQQEFQHEYGTAQDPTGGHDWLRTLSTAGALAPLGGLASAPLKGLGLGAEAFGLGSAAEGTGLAGGLSSLGGAIANPASISLRNPLLTYAARIAASSTGGAGIGAYLGLGRGDVASQTVGGAAGGALAVPAASLVGAAVKPIAGAVGSVINGEAADTVRNWFNSAFQKARGTQAPQVAPIVEGINVPPQTPEGVVTQNTVADALKAHGLDPQALPPDAANDMAQEAATQKTVNGQIDPMALARRTNLIANGIQPTKAMVSRDWGDWNAEHDLANKPGGEAVKQAHIQASQAISNKLQSISDKAGGNLPDDTSAANYTLGNNAIQSIKGLWDSTGKQVSQAYQDVRNAVGGDTGLVPNSLSDELDRLSDNPAYHGAISTIQNTIKRLSGGSGQLTVDQAEGLRQQVGNLLDNTAQGNYFRRSVKSAIENDVIQTAGGDQFAPARQMAAQRFQDFSGPMAQKIVNGTLTPENFFDRLVKSGSIDDLNQTLNLLKKTPAGNQVVSQLQQRTADHVINQATAADGSIKPAALNNTLFGQRGLGQPKIQSIFGQDGLNQYTSLNQAAQDALSKPIGVSTAASGNPSGTAYALQRMGNLGTQGVGALIKAHVPHMVVNAVEGAAEGIQKGAAERAAQAEAAQATSGSQFTQQDIMAALRAKAQAAKASQVNIGRLLQGPATIVGAATNRPTEPAQP